MFLLPNGEKEETSRQTGWHPEIDPYSSVAARWGLEFSSGNLVGGEPGEALGFWAVTLVSVRETVSWVYNDI